VCVGYHCCNITIQVHITLYDWNRLGLFQLQFSCIKCIALFIGCISSWDIDTDECCALSANCCSCECWIITLSVTVYHKYVLSQSNIAYHTSVWIINRCNWYAHNLLHQHTCNTRCYVWLDKGYLTTRRWTMWTLLVCNSGYDGISS